MPEFIRNGSLITPLVVITSLTAVVFLQFNVIAEYVSTKKRDDFTIIISLFAGLIKIAIDIPVADFGKKGLINELLKNWLKSHKKNQKEREAEKNLQEQKWPDFDEIINRIIYVEGLFKLNRAGIFRLLDYLKGRLEIKRFNLVICSGTNDACHTALLTGFLHMMAGTVVSYLKNNFGIGKVKLEITPDFMQKKLNIELDCILSLRIIHIINMAGIFLSIKPKKMERGGGNIGTAPY